MGSAVLQRPVQHSSFFTCHPERGRREETPSESKEPTLSEAEGICGCREESEVGLQAAEKLFGQVFGRGAALTAPYKPFILVITRGLQPPRDLLFDS